MVWCLCGRPPNKRPQPTQHALGRHEAARARPRRHRHVTASRLRYLRGRLGTAPAATGQSVDWYLDGSVALFAALLVMIVMRPRSNRRLQLTRLGVGYEEKSLARR